MLQRAGWGIADQALSSLTNFALGLLVARSVAPTSFGAFSIAFATFVVGLGFSRALASEPLVVRYSVGSGADWRWGATTATGVALAAGVAFGLACVVVGWALGTTSPLAASFVALGLTFPGLLLQDCWRFAFFASGRGRAAFTNDAVCAVVMFGVLAALHKLGHATVFALILSWGGAATVGAVAGAVQARLVPAPRRLVAWYRAHGDLISRYLGESVVNSSGGQLSVYAVGALGGLAAVGALRAGYLLFGPLQVLFMGVGLMSVPELVRMLQRSPRHLYVAGTALSAALAVMAMLWGLVIALTPNAVGEAALGATWRVAHPLATAVTIGWIGSGLIAGAAGGMRALGAARRGLTARLAGSAVAVGGAVIGAALAGAAGAAIGLAFAGWVEAAVSWWLFRRAMLERVASVGTPVADTLGFIARGRAVAVGLTSSDGR